MTSNQAVQNELPGAAGNGGGPYEAGALPATQGGDVLHYLAVLLDYWWLVFLCLLVGASIGAWRWRVQDDSPTFGAGCRVEVSADAREGSDGRPGGARRELVAEELERLTILLRSATLHQSVQAKLNGEWAERLAGGSLEARVVVDPVRGSDSMLDIRVDAGDGDYALAYLNRLYAEYKEERRRRVEERQERATESLQRERDSLQVQWGEARARLMQFQASNNMRLTEAKAAYDEQFLAGLVQRENAVRMERTMLEGQLAVLADVSTATINELADLNSETHRLTVLNIGAGAAKGEAGKGDAGKAPVIDASSAVLAERASTAGREEELANSEAEYQGLMQRYKPSHPKMQELSLRMERTRRFLQTSKAVAEERLRARYKALDIQGQSLATAAEKWKAESGLTDGERTTYEELKTTVEHLKSRYDQVYTRILDTRVAQGETVFLTMVEPASGRGRNLTHAYNVMLVALVLALAMGTGLAFLLDYLDTSLRDPDAIEQRFGFAYLHGIPHWGHVLQRFDRRKDVVVVSRNRQNPATEVYRNLRGILDKAIGECGSYALLITSAQAGEGKSTTAANLAVTFSWTGRRVLLVDGDLRRGVLHKAMALPEGKGLTDVLSGDVADWRTVAQATEYPNLTFLAAGSFRRDAPELLRPAGVRALLGEFRAAYDVIVFDSPPIGKVVEADLYSLVCDGTLLVTRFGKTRYTDVRHAARHLDGANVLGFCVNRVEFSKKRFAGVYSSECYDAKSYQREKAGKADHGPVPQAALPREAA
jgi:capsular exopolysaccharide synthesis family protein